MSGPSRARRLFDAVTQGVTAAASHRLRSALGALAIAVTGALATRGVLRTSPATTLRAIAG